MTARQTAERLVATYRANLVASEMPLEELTTNIEAAIAGMHRALERIAHHKIEGVVTHEWAEAEAYRKVKQIAREALQL